MRPTRAAVLFLMTIVSPALAQTTQAPVFRARTDVLAVDVSVVDSNGEPISDLGKAEFTVTVDGEVRPVMTVDYIAFEDDGDRAAPPSLGAAAHFSSNEGDRGGRLIAIVIDQGNIRLGTGRGVSQELGRLLERLTPTDRIALIAIPAPGPVVDFTTDHDLIREGLTRVTGRGSPLRSSYNISETEALEFESGLNPQALDSVMARECTEFADNPEARAACVALLGIEADRIATELRQRSTASILSLRSLVRAFGDIEGPKTLIYVSEGLVTQRRYEEIADIGTLAGAAQVTIHVVLLEGPRVDLTRRLAPTTPIQDRRMRVEGLEIMSGLARGGLFRDIGMGGRSFDRLARELSGYYLLGVEPAEDDRDGESHEVKVEVSRRGATVRARRQFQFPDPDEAPRTAQERVVDALQAPISAVDVPLRVASYAFLDAATPQVRVVAALEAGQVTRAPTELTIGYVLTDSAGDVVSSGVESRSTAVDDQEPGEPLEYSTALLVDPGIYRLKIAAVDADGRRGSVEHTVNAWQMDGELFAVGDLLLADTPTDGSLEPGVVVQLDSGQLGAYTEMYSTDPTKLQGIQVTVEVADDDDGPALTSGPAQVKLAEGGLRASAQSILPMNALPPGPYLARAVFSDEGRTIGKLVRPFVVPAGLPPASPTISGPTAAGSAAPAVSAASAGRPFRRDDALVPEVLSYFVDDIASSLPSSGGALEATFARARVGELDGAALEALGAGDQVAAAFFRGLELFAAGNVNDAATQFRSTLQSGARLGSIWFYLGACYAVAGRDQQAAAFWRNLPLEDGVPREVYAIAADLWVSVGDTATAIPPLRDALSRWPDDDDLRRRLGVAYALAGQPADAVTTLGPYLERTMSDHETLQVAIRALYDAHAAGGSVGTPEEDQVLASRYATAYAAANGPDQALVNRWAAFVADDGRE